MLLGLFYMALAANLYLCSPQNIPKKYMIHEATVAKNENGGDKYIKLVQRG